MVTDASKETPRTPAVQRTASYLQALKVPALFVVVTVGVLAAYYSLYVREKAEYLTGRNLRLVASLGRQIETALEDHEAVLGSFSNYYGPKNVATGFRCAAILSARSVPIFEYIAVESGATTSTLESKQCIQWEARLRRSTSGASSSSAQSVLFEERDSGLMWTRRQAAGKKLQPAATTFRVALRDVLSRTLSDHVLTRVFDAVVLTTTSGRVLHEGDASPLRLTTLNRLPRRQSDGSWKELEFSTLPMASQVLDVEVSGGRYLLYLQPCCTHLSEAGTPGANAGWVIAGLMDARKFRAASMAVSFSVMALMAAAILLAIFSWPFVKLTLIGEGQRLRLVDVLVVGICCILGTSLISVIAIDYFAYGSLKDDVDHQLQTLSAKIRASMKIEVQQAFKQLQTLEEWADPSKFPDRVPNLFTKDVQVSYPPLESFALIDAHGEQQWKFAAADFTTPRISTQRREYFRHWLEPHAAWPAYYLQSIRSGTTGRKQAVLSTRTNKPRLAVAALTIPMISLTEAVLPPGFLFAVINDDGDVVFHSDVRHSLDEQLFLETDRQRRLRAAATARRDEVMNVRYFGRDHRAYIAPVDWPEGAHWSLVTFFDKELVRTINVEWLITTLIFTVLYVGVYVVICAGILLWRPAYRAPWIWPDPAREQRYQRLIPSYAMFAIPFALAIYSFRDRYLLAVAWLLPCVVWIGTYLVLTRRDGPWRTKTTVTFGAGLILSGLLFLALRQEADRGLAIATVAMIAFVLPAVGVRAPVRHAYVIAASMLLMLTVVLPTLAFFKVAHAIQVESFVKHGQLRLARQLQRRSEGVRHEYERLQAQGLADVADRLRALREELSVYGAFFFDTVAWTEPAREGACEPRDTPAPTQHQDARSELPKAIEDLLPYYSEASVAMRELLHDRASDNAWAWHRTSSHLRMHSPASIEGRTVGEMVCLQSTVPSLFATSSGWQATTVRLIQVMLLALLPVLTVAWIVRFVTRRIFLIDVVEPLAARKAVHAPMRSGAHVYLLWPAARRRGALAGEGTCIVDFAQPPTDVPMDEWLAGERERVERSPAGSMIVIDHIEHAISDAAFNTRKLTLINEVQEMAHRTVVLVSVWTPKSLGRRMADAAGPGDANPVSGLWAITLARFTVVEAELFVGAAEPVAVAAAAAAAASESAADSQSAASQSAPRQPVVVVQVTMDPEEEDPVVRHVWTEVRTAAKTLGTDMTLDKNQLYEEVGDRLDTYYQGIWSSCSPAERIVLQQLAQEGLLNEKNRKTIRDLLGRGLIRKSPNFQVFNETFRRFALSRAICAQVAALERLDSQTPSTWDAIRLPFLIALLGMSVFFFLTQRQLFTTTMAVVTALAGGIPAIVRLVGVFERRPPA